MSQSTAIAPFVVIIISQMADLFVDHDAPCPSNVRWFDLRREGSRWDLYSIFSLPSSSLVLMISQASYIFFTIAHHQNWKWHGWIWDYRGSSWGAGVGEQPEGGGRARWSWGNGVWYQALLLQNLCVINNEWGEGPSYLWWLQHLDTTIMHWKQLHRQLPRLQNISIRPNTDMKHISISRALLTLGTLRVKRDLQIFNFIMKYIDIKYVWRFNCPLHLLI